MVDSGSQDQNSDWDMNYGSLAWPLQELIHILQIMGAAKGSEQEL